MPENSAPPTDKIEEEIDLSPDGVAAAFREISASATAAPVVDTLPPPAPVAEAPTPEPAAPLPAPRTLEQVEAELAEERRLHQQTREQATRRDQPPTPARQVTQQPQLRSLETIEAEMDDVEFADRAKFKELRREYARTVNAIEYAERETVQRQRAAEAAWPEAKRIIAERYGITDPAQIELNMYGPAAYARAYIEQIDTPGSPNYNPQEAEQLRLMMTTPDGLLTLYSKWHGDAPQKTPPLPAPPLPAAPGAPPGTRGAAPSTAQRREVPALDPDQERFANSLAEAGNMLSPTEIDEWKRENAMRRARRGA